MNIIEKIHLGIKSYKWIYILAVGSIFILVATSQFLIQRSIKKQEKDALIINLAGKQRMLSQNISKNALILGQSKVDTINDSVRRESLSQLLDEWESVHVGLQKGDIALALPGENTREVRGMFDQIGKHFDAIHAAGSRLLFSKDPVESQKLVETILFHEPNYLFGMNAIVKLYETEANRKLERLKRTEATLAILTICILFVEVLLVFLPSYTRLKKQRDSLIQTNQELKVAQKQVEEAASAKENLFSVVTHELRTPLNAIIGVSDLMAEEEVPESQREHVSILRSSSRQLLALINDILDLSKVRSGVLELESIPFDLHEEVREIRELFKLKAREKSLFLRFYIPNSIPQYVEGDPVRLRQILTNLVNNAMKFTKIGGITISIEMERQNKEEGVFIFTVADTGVGVPEAKLDSIFTEFTQVDSSTTRKYGGTGLGLAITKQLVEAHGGTIKVESKVDEGSRFIFSLQYPISQASQVKQHLGKYSMKNLNADILKGLRILVAEDDQMNQFVIRKLMTRWEVDFVIANNGREAIEYLLNEDPFDLVLMDFDMPEMGGPEATLKIRAINEPYFQQIPIIAITASAMEAVENTLIETGMNDFIPKPFYSKDLAGIISKYAVKEV